MPNRKVKATQKGSTEFFVLDENGNKQDAELHANMLRDSEGAGFADLYAVRRAVAAGVPFQEAVATYASGAARMLLRREGLL